MPWADRQLVAVEYASTSGVRLVQLRKGDARLVGDGDIGTPHARFELLPNGSGTVWLLWAYDLPAISSSALPLPIAVECAWAAPPSPPQPPASPSPLPPSPQVPLEEQPIFSVGVRVRLFNATCAAMPTVEAALVGALGGVTTTGNASTCSLLETLRLQASPDWPVPSPSPSISPSPSPSPSFYSLQVAGIALDDVSRANLTTAMTEVGCMGRAPCELVPADAPSRALPSSPSLPPSPAPPSSPLTGSQRLLRLLRRRALRTLDARRLQRAAEPEELQVTVRFGSSNGDGAGAEPTDEVVLTAAVASLLSQETHPNASLTLLVESGAVHVELTLAGRGTPDAVLQAQFSTSRSATPLYSSSSSRLCTSAGAGAKFFAGARST